MKKMVLIAMVTMSLLTSNLYAGEREAMEALVPITLGLVVAVYGGVTAGVGGGNLAVPLGLGVLSTLGGVVSLNSQKEFVQQLQNDVVDYRASGEMTATLETFVSELHKKYPELSEDDLIDSL